MISTRLDREAVSVFNSELTSKWTKGCSVNVEDVRMIEICAPDAPNAPISKRIL